MDAVVLEQQKQELIARYGPWKFSNIHLGGGVYTISPGLPPSARLIRFPQIIADIMNRPFSELRILDLACQEAEYAVELASRGARVLGIEGRTADIERAKFARDTLGLTNLELVQDDVRNLSVDKYGMFDVVLCSGILYHLDAPDVFAFLERVGEVCLRCAIVDTHVSQSAKASVTHSGHEYWGWRYIEHHSNSTPKERERASGASLDNIHSFWLTRPSLFNSLVEAGFSSVYECHVPVHVGLKSDRAAFVALRGESQAPTTSTPLAATPRWSEQQPEQATYALKKYVRSAVMRLPYPIARLAKTVLRSTRRLTRQSNVSRSRT